MNAWERQRALGRTTVVWGAASIAGGALLMARGDRWRRAFGAQHLGWGAVDLAIVAAARALQTRRMRRLPNPYAPATLERERRILRAILLVNVAADAAYVVGGVILWRRRPERAGTAGAGAAIALQGGFLLLHDGYHAVRSHG